MKKFALMFAALSLCACTFTACGDDGDDSPSKAKKGESCEKVECDTGLKCNDSKVCEEDAAGAKAKKGEACEKVDCDTGLFCSKDKVCTEYLKEGVACDDTTVCDLGLQCDDTEKKCAKAKLGDSCEVADCDDNLVCDDNKKCIEKPKGKAGDHCEKTEDCEENLTCEDHEGNKICTKAASEGDCMSNSDCKDPEKPVCGDNYKCVAAPTDLCEGKCTDGAECVLGICVTEAMKALQDGDDYPAGVSTSFCNGDTLVAKTKAGKVGLIDCKANGYNGCVVHNMNGSAEADCNGQAAALDACKSAPNASPDLDSWRIDTCLTSTELYEVYCTKDLSGNDIAVPTYNGKNDKTAEECGTCSIENDGPKCSNDSGNE